METSPQEPVEPTPLVEPPRQEPVLLSTRIWTIIAFAFYSVGVLLLLITSFRVYTVLSLAVLVGSVYLVYRYTTSRIGGPSVRHDLAQAYFACGMWLYPLVVSILNALFLLISYVLVAVLLYSTQPSWLMRIGNAINEFSKHGELKVGGVKWDRMQELLLSKSKNPLKGVPVHALQVIFSPRQHSFTVASGLTTAIRALVNGAHVASPKVIQHGKYAEEIAKMLRSMVFQDGTKAGPLFGELLRSFASIPLWVTIPLFSVIEVGLIFIMLSIFAMFANNPLGRTNPTVRTVTACAVSLQLGTSALLILTIAANPRSVWELALLLPSIALSLAIGALIGMRLFDNSQTVFEEEKRPVILLPAALRLITSLTALVCSLVVIRQLLYITADAAELRIDLGTVEPLFEKWIVVAVGVPLLVLLAVAFYAVRLAHSRFFSISHT